MKINTLSVLAVLVLIIAAFFAGISLQPYWSGQAAAVATSRGYSIMPNPSTIMAKAGVPSSVVASIGLHAFSGFNGSVTLTASGACGVYGITCSPNHTSVALFKNGTGMTPITVASAATTPPGTYIIVLTGSANGMSQTSNLVLKVSK